MRCRRASQNGFSALTTPAPCVQRLPAPPASVTTATAPAASASSPMLRKFASHISPCVKDIFRRNILNLAGDGQSILRESDVSGPQLGLDPLMLDRIESVLIRAATPESPLAPFAAVDSRQEPVEEARARGPVRPARHAKDALNRSRSAALACRNQPLIFSQQAGQHKVVVAVGQNRIVAGQQLGKRAALVDGEVVDHRLHRKRHAAGKLSADLAHQFAQDVSAPPAFRSGSKMKPMPPPDMPPSIQKPQKSSPNSARTSRISVSV